MSVSSKLDDGKIDYVCASIASHTLISVNITNGRVSSTIGATGPYNISVLTNDLAVIATGVIPSSFIGRPSEPRNIRVINCPADYPAPDPRCLQVEWDPPRDDAGSAVTSYRVTVDAKSNAFTNVVQKLDLKMAANIPRLIQTITLSEGIVHYVKVEAANEKGSCIPYLMMMYTSKNMYTSSYFQQMMYNGDIYNLTA